MSQKKGKGIPPIRVQRSHIDSIPHTSDELVLTKLIVDECKRDLLTDMNSNQSILRLNLDAMSDRPFLTDHVVNSVFLPGLGAKFLELLDTLPTDSFVLGVGYTEAKGGDAQQGITGTFNSELDRTASETIYRETLEESKLSMPSTVLIHASEIHKGQKWNHCATSISTCSVPSEFHHTRVQKRFDDRSKKISNSIYGTAEEMINAFVQIATARPMDNDDGIAYVIATPVSVVKKLVRISMGENKKGNKWTPTKHIVHDL